MTGYRGLYISESFIKMSLLQRVKVFNLLINAYNYLTQAFDIPPLKTTMKTYCCTATRLFSSILSILAKTAFPALFAPALCYSSPDLPARIHYGFPDQFVLTTKVGANGQPDNPLLRLSSIILEQADLQWDYMQYPAARLFKNLEEGTANFSILVNAPQLRGCCIVSSQPIFKTELRIYRRSYSPKIETLDDLINKKVITIRGYSYGRLRNFLTDSEHLITRYSTDSHDSAFSMLEAKRAEYLLDYKGPSIETLKKRPIDDITFDTIDQVDVHIVLHKSYPNAQAHMHRFEYIVSNLDLDDILSLPY